jgi:hypothetical protein
VLPLADVSFGEVLLMVFEIFLFVVYIWILWTILTDLFRNHEMSGWLKAAWIVLLVFIPYLTALVYLIVYGSDMRERQLRAQAEAKHEAEQYIRAAAHVSPPTNSTNCTTWWRKARSRRRSTTGPSRNCWRRRARRQAEPRLTKRVAIRAVTRPTF